MNTNTNSSSPHANMAAPPLIGHDLWNQVGDMIWAAITKWMLDNWWVIGLLLSSYFLILGLLIYLVVKVNFITR